MGPVLVEDTCLCFNALMCLSVRLTVVDRVDGKKMVAEDLGLNRILTLSYFALLTLCPLFRAQLGKAYQTTGVLFEVLCYVNNTEKVEQAALERLDSNAQLDCMLLCFCSPVLHLSLLDLLQVLCADWWKSYRVISGEAD